MFFQEYGYGLQYFKIVCFLISKLRLETDLKLLQLKIEFYPSIQTFKILKFTYYIYAKLDCMKSTFFEG